MVCLREKVVMANFLASKPTADKRTGEAADRVNKTANAGQFLQADISAEDFRGFAITVLLEPNSAAYTWKCSDFVLGILLFSDLA
jgi:hypothetical protein